MNQPNPESQPDKTRAAAHLTEDEIICTALGDADFLLQARADAHAENCLKCRERIRFYKEIDSDPGPPSDHTKAGDRRGSRTAPLLAGLLARAREDVESLAGRPFYQASPTEMFARRAEVSGTVWDAERAESRPSPVAEITFAALNADFRTHSTERERAHFVAALMDPQARPWFRACHALVHAGAAEECGAELLGALSVLPELQAQMARLHHAIARALRAADRSLETAALTFENLARDFAEPQGLIADIAQELLTAPELLAEVVAKALRGGPWHGDLRPAEREERVGGVLIEGDGSSAAGTTIAVFVTLEVVACRKATTRSLCLYPVPAIALWDRDADFRAAEVEAAAFAEGVLPDDCAAEVRWRLTRYVGGALPGRMCGPSLGMALGFLLRRIFARPEETIARVDLSGLAVTGGIARSGATRPVGSLLAKALHDESFHTLLAPLQQLVHPHLKHAGVPGDDALTAALSSLGDRVHVIRAEDVLRSAEALEVDQQTRWPAFDFTAPEVPRDFVGRERLTGEILDFIRTTPGGYGVISGGMGTGKTTFMKHLLRCLAAAKIPLAFHFVPAQPGAACRGEPLARKIYYHLRRTHCTPEPLAWAEWDMPQKLAELLKFLGGKNAAAGRKTVIVIDAADAVEMPAGQKLVPDILPAEMPPGMICLISSRPGLGWLHDRSLVARFFKMGDGGGGMKSSTDDHADIRQFLAQQQTYPLPEALVTAMLERPEPPFFFTVVKRLTELHDDNLTAERKRDYLGSADLWLRPPEELIRRQISHIATLVDPSGERLQAVLDTLGLIAVVREPVSEEVLRGLALWQEGFSSTILKKAASFFLPPEPGLLRHQVPYRFDHQGYSRVILELIGDDGRERCHRRLGERCLELGEIHGAARRYALRFGPAHLRRARMWKELYGMLTDFEFLEERMLWKHPAGSEGHRADGAPDMPQRLAARVLRDLERALLGQPCFPEDSRWRPAIAALHAAVETHMATLHEAPELLVQQLYNTLAWDWDEETDLGGKLRRALRETRHIVLQRRSRPVAPPAGVRRLIFKGHRASVNSVALSPRGDVVASGSSDTMVFLWNVETGGVLHILRGHTASVRAVTWSHAGHLLASLGESIRLWDPVSGASLGALPAVGDSTAIAFSPVEEILAIGGADGSVRLVSPRDQQTIGLLRERGKKVRCLAFSHDGRVLAVSTANDAEQRGIVDLYDVAGRSHLRTLPSLPYWGETLGFLPDDKTVATGGGVDLGELILHDVATGSFQRKLELHRSGIKSLAIAQTGAVVTGSFDYTLRLHDLTTAATLRTGMTHLEVVRSVAIARDARFVISAGADRNVIAWHFGETPTVSAPRTAAALARGAHEHIINATRFSPDGRWVSTASRDGTARIFESGSRAPGRVFTMGTDTVSVAEFSPDGSRIAIGSHNVLKIFDLATGAELHCLLGHKSWILDLVWTPDGAHLVSVSQDTTAMVWDTRTGAWLRTFNGHTARLRAVALSPDGRIVATAGDDARIHLWDLATGQLQRTLHGHELRIKALAFAPDGRLASAGSDEFIKIWDPLTGRELATLPCRALEVWTLRFAPARFLAVGGKDGLARLFDLSTGRQVAYLPCADAVQALWFSPDGTEVRIADRGAADLIPNIHVVQIVLPAINPAGN